jgi:hypothetical protein
MSDYWSEGGTNSRRRNVLVGTLALDTEGGTAGDIPASTFGLTKIEEVLPLVADDNSAVILAAPSYDGTSLLTLEIDEADGSINPVDAPTDTYSCTIKGY